MRDFDHYQLSLMSQSWVEHPHAEELAEIGEILDSDPGLVNLVISDLFRGLRFPQRGARGLSPTLVLRALILKQMHGYSYDELVFHLTDSVSFRAFCGIDAGQRAPKRSALQKNFKRIRPETLAAISTANRLPYFIFCKRFGWSMTSSMPQRYIDRAGVSEMEVARLYYQDRQTGSKSSLEGRRTGAMSLGAGPGSPELGIDHDEEGRVGGANLKPEAAIATWRSSRTQRI